MSGGWLRGLLAYSKAIAAGLTSAITVTVAALPESVLSGANRGFALSLAGTLNLIAVFLAKNTPAIEAALAPVVVTATTTAAPPAPVVPPPA